MTKYIAQTVPASQPDTSEAAKQKVKHKHKPSSKQLKKYFGASQGDATMTQA